MFSLALLWLAHLPSILSTSSFPTWCGKYYHPDAPRSPPSPSTKYQNPPLSRNGPKLNFRCSQAIRPYVAGMDESGEIVVDLGLDDRVGLEWNGPEDGELWIKVLVDANEVGQGRFRANTTGSIIAIDLNRFEPTFEIRKLECTIMNDRGQVRLKSDSSEFRFLPPTDHGVVKMDSRTGAIMVPTDRGYGPLFPVGFYIAFEGYLASNLSLLDDMKDRGFNLFHPVPHYKDAEALKRVLDRAEELGLWLMYDMRHTYMNLTSVREQVEMIKSRNNLLLWYTTDEPDGPSDPLDSTIRAYELIRSIDPYHPISLVLNCADFEWSSYSAGADVILTDPYPFYVDTKWSLRYNTECDEGFGCCGELRRRIACAKPELAVLKLLLREGCDNCEGSLQDVITRLDDSRLRTHYEGRDRNLSTWLIPQALGGDEFWTRPPSGQEFLAMSILGLNHGAKGILPWTLPTSDDILNAATLLAKSLPDFLPYIVSADAVFRKIIYELNSSSSAVDVGLWTLATSNLLVVVNLVNETTVIDLSHLAPKEVSHIVLESSTAILSSGRDGTITLKPFGTGAWVLNDSPTAGEAERLRFQESWAAHIDLR